jgi:Ca2+-transporting ATPase
MRGDWLQAVLGGIALGMSMLPEEFPLVLSVFMVMGAWRISKAHVLTRRASAIETLGATTVLCTDKTGTLTLNQMNVVALEDQGGSFFFETSTATPERFQPLIRLAALASVDDPHDPMESAIHRLAASVPNPQDGLNLLKTYGLRPELLAVTQVWKQADGTQLYACKGAPETVASLCGLPPDTLKKSVEEMAQRGIRVLAVAQAIVPDDALPETIKGLPFHYAGLIGLADPLRDSVIEAVTTCRAAGIKIVMITGDYPTTAHAIATQAGLSDGAVLTGEELSRLTDEDLQARIAAITVFARIMPEQKLRIVQAFKQNDEIVAMTGDGVNDAPALQAAHIGIAMGRRGTDVAREAASIVLLEDDFDSIVQTIRLGRRIYNNLQKVMRYIIAVHIPIAGMALLPLALGHPMILTPIHIALLEMLIDPVCALVFEAEDEGKNLMRHKPRDPQAPLIPAGLMLLSFLQGLLALVGVAGVYFWFHAQGLPEDQVRALSFTALVVSNIALIFTNRTLHPSIWDTLRRKNPLMIWVALATTAIMTALLTIPPLEKLLKFGAVHGDDIALTFVVCAAIFLAAEGMKSIRHAILHSTRFTSRKDRGILKP